MKNSWLLIILLFPLVLSGQPQGKLFIHSGFVSNNELGYIQYPQNQYHVIDSGDLDDMIIIEDKLLVSNGKIYSYDLATLTINDSINTANAYMLAGWNNKLAVTKSEAPYFEVYDLLSKTLIFSLNTNKIKSQPIDILVDLNRAYLLYDTSIVIVDLNLQDTIATVITTQPVWFPEYNQYLINKGNKVYIDVEIATGAPRFSILSLDKSTLQVENVLFYEFIDTPFEPVLDGNKLYMSTFPSYYDIAADSFFYIQNSNMMYPLCFDEISNTVFLYKPTDFKINYFTNNTIGTDVSIPTYMNKAVYYNEAITSIADQKEISDQINIYPNPACNELNIKLQNEKMVKEIRIITINGDQTVLNINNKRNYYKLDISKLPEGLYFIEIQFENQSYKNKFIKTNHHN